MMKKIVVKLSFQDEKVKKNPMEAVSSIEGIVSMSVDGDKITVIGDVDPVQVVGKLKKWYPKLDTVGPAKEEKKEDKKPAGGDDKDAAAKKKAEEEMAWCLAYQRMHHNPNYYYAQPDVHNYNDHPSSCVIC